MNNVDALTIQPNVYYTVDEAARLPRTSRQSMLRLLRTGRARGVQIGRQWRIWARLFWTCRVRLQKTRRPLSLSGWKHPSRPGRGVGQRGGCRL